jgi:adhesin transport system membrane fusion protein
MKLRISPATLMFGGLALSVGWAACFDIDQAVRAQGQIIPVARTQVIQVADGGVLSRVLVQEGQSVRAGQTLAVLERERPNAAFEERRAHDAALALALIRAQAEAGGHAPRFGDKYREFPDFIATQQALYDQKKRSLDQESAALRDSLDMAQEELRMNENLFKTGDTSRVEVMRARRQVTELLGRISATRNKYLQDARQEAARLADELSSSRYKLDEQKSVLDHTTVTAPVDGIVKTVKVTTIGGVLRPGDELMQISPTSGGMVVEVRVSPSDIGQLKVGLPAYVKLDAFDYSIYGNLKGTLNYISSDTLTEQGAGGQAVTYYRARVALDEPVGHQARPGLPALEVKPGMTATVDLRTASRSVLNYLVKPIFKAFAGALNER